MLELLNSYFKNWGHESITFFLILILLYFSFSFWKDFSKPSKKVSKELNQALKKLRDFKSKGIGGFKDEVQQR
jgi:predicted negative regulator of RcsB-dependent stress response